MHAPWTVQPLTRSPAPAARHNSPLNLKCFSARVRIFCACTYQPASNPPATARLMRTSAFMARRVGASSSAAAGSGGAEEGV